jgi:hypothetical protein
MSAESNSSGELITRTHDKESEGQEKVKLGTVGFEGLPRERTTHFSQLLSSLESVLARAGVVTQGHVHQRRVVDSRAFT